MATASAIGVWKPSAVTTGALSPSRRRIGSATTPTQTAPQARVRRARELRKLASI